MGSGIRKMSDIGDNVLYRESDFLSPILDKNRISTIRVYRETPFGESLFLIYIRYVRHYQNQLHYHYRKDNNHFRI